MVLPNEEKLLHNNNKTNHNKNNSGEIDVFEAAGYYAGTNDFTYKGQSEVNKLRQSNISRGRGGASLDIVFPMRHQVAAHDPNEPAAPKAENITKHKKHKQPSSPGARISHFLNSLFNQKLPSKKKNSSSSSKSSMNIEEEEDDEISPTGRRKSRRRRSSISGIWIATTRPIMGSTSSIKYRNPLPLIPPREEALSTNENSVKEPSAHLGDEEPKDSSCGLSSERVSKDSSQEKEGFKGFDDGWDSDSSSDLFELQLGREFRFSSSDVAHGECVRRIGLTTTTNNYPVKS